MGSRRQGLSTGSLGAKPRASIFSEKSSETVDVCRAPIERGARSAHPPQPMLSARWGDGATPPVDLRDPLRDPADHAKRWTKVRGNRKVIGFFRSDGL
jgi:hypothetical protein